MAGKLRGDMDELDAKIIERLLKDSRKSLRSIAKELGTPTSTVHERVKRLVKLGVIRRFTAELDLKLLGLDITALILVSVDGAHITEVEKTLSTYDQVIAVYDITGEFDVALIAKFRNMDELNNFIKTILKMPYIKRTVTSVVFNVVKEKLCMDIVPKYQG
ncbi:MAG: AsnC family transcriptional regulator [Desulfurococcaceae archaeon]|jgi:DNA-binding Lrp family transcriptional regulator|nr:MAG: AsnC family transcriptional regulator [Desulfurococcaceae archaeon]